MREKKTHTLLDFVYFWRGGGFFGDDALVHTPRRHILIPLLPSTKIPNPIPLKEDHQYIDCELERQHLYFTI